MQRHQHQQHVGGIGMQSYHRYQDVERFGEAVRPLDFPPPAVRTGVRVNALVVHPQTGSRQVCSGVIHREDLSEANAGAPDYDGGSSNGDLDDEDTYDSVQHGMRREHRRHSSSRRQQQQHQEQQQQQQASRQRILAYWPQRRLQDAIYGSVWVCIVLRKHYGVASDDAARAAGVEPGSSDAPIVWEITDQHVAIKMVEWSRVHHMRGRLLEDPVKEVSAMQLLSSSSVQPSPYVLHSIEVLQDDDFLYSVMPYCYDGDLFGIVVQYAEDSGGDLGMPEPVARYWFKQILWGLNHLQTQGICHRDLSLENVLVDGDRCMIIDMGMCLRVPYNDPRRPGTVTDISRATAASAAAPPGNHQQIPRHQQQQRLHRRLIRPQGVCGKHNYMSPEVFANTEPFDGFAIDLWAGGVILYIMLTGFPPYDQASRTDQRFDLIVTGRLVEQLRNWDIFLTDQAGDLLQNMLRLDPRDRLSLAEVMQHPWVTNDNVQPPAPPEPILSFR